MKATKQKVTTPYQNNPFFVATDGMSLLFKHGLQIAIFMIVLMGLSLVANIASSVYDAVEMFSNPLSQAEQSAQDKKDSEALVAAIQGLDLNDWIAIGGIAAIIIVGLIVIGTFIMGISDYTASRLAKGKVVTFTEAVRGVGKDYIGYLGVQILVWLKVLAWSLLFIIPGIIMAVRYSLAGVSYFDKKRNPVQAVNHSIELTKGAWLTTFASYNLFNLITIGLIQGLLWPGITAVLYRQYSAHAVKPPAHALSWVALSIPIVLTLTFGLMLALGILLAVLAYNVAP